MRKPMIKPYKCPKCNRKLVKKKDGYVCKNWKCDFYWKLGRGWVYHAREDKID